MFRAFGDDRPELFRDDNLCGVPTVCILSLCFAPTLTVSSIWSVFGLGVHHQRIWNEWMCEGATSYCI